MLNLKIKKTHPDARLPRYATDGSGAFDLFAVGEPEVGRNAVYNTGLAFEVPEGHVMLVFSRSGHGFRHGVRLANGVGVIDSDYRGTVRVALQRDDTLFDAGLFDWRSITRVGDAIAQAIVVPFPRVTFEEVEELTDTERGIGGFGSTDAPTLIPAHALRGLVGLDATGGKLACPLCGNEHKVKQVSEFVGYCAACNEPSPLQECVLARVSASASDFFVWPNGTTLPRTDRDTEVFKLALEASQDYRIVRDDTEAPECDTSGDVAVDTTDIPKDE